MHLIFWRCSFGVHASRRYPGRHLLPLLSSADLILLLFHDCGSTLFRSLHVNTCINMLTLTTSLVGEFGGCMYAWVHLMMPVYRIHWVIPVPETHDAAHVYPFVS